MVHWRREWQTSSVLLPREHHEQYVCVCIYMYKTMKINQVVDFGIYIYFAIKQYALEK